MAELPWDRKRKKPWEGGEPFGDFFFDFDRIEEMMDEMVKGMFESGRPSKKPMMMGFQIKFDSNGKPIVEEFGNIKRSEEGKPVVADAREPLVDVVKSGKEITITAELPGVEKKDIKIDTKGKNIVTVRADLPERKFYKEIDLKEPVDKKTAKADFKNGILEVVFKRAKPAGSEEEGSIKIG